VIDDHKVTYQSITPAMVERIVTEHILNGTPVAEWVTQEDYLSYHSRQHKIVLGPAVK